MLTYAPLPTWTALGRALMHDPPPGSDLATPWRGDGSAAGWLSRTAWSLALVALWRKRRSNGRTTTMWVPDYFCNAALEAVRVAGVKLVFYPLTSTLDPDLSACRLLAVDGKPDLFVLAHYFGRPASASGARDFCTHHDAWLIEDAAQILRAIDGVGEYGDFVLYSPHKHLPIPDGAVLVVRSNGPGKLSQEQIASLGKPSNWPAQLGDLHGKLARARRTRASADIAWLTKRVLQNIGVRRPHSLIAPFVEAPHPSGATAPPLPKPDQSSLARRLLAGLIPSLGDVARKRQRNLLIWDALLCGDAPRNSGSLVTAERPGHREWTPYLGVYGVSQATAEAVYDDWQRQGIPVSTWPDLPPEVNASRSRHSNAWRLRHERLFLPVHQSLSAIALAKARPSSSHR